MRSVAPTAAGGKTSVMNFNTDGSVLQAGDSEFTRLPGANFKADGNGTRRRRSRGRRPSGGHRGFRHGRAAKESGAPSGKQEPAVPRRLIREIVRGRRANITALSFVPKTPLFPEVVSRNT